MRFDGIWRDRELSAEVAARLQQAGLAAEGAGGGDGFESANTWVPLPGSGEEAIILSVGRPAIFVQDDAFQVDSSEVWTKRLTRARTGLLKALPTVGRIETINANKPKMVGTGWLLAPDVVVTNRHVAKILVQPAVKDWQFADGQHLPQIEMRGEHERDATNAVTLASVIHIEPDTGPDIAFLKLARPLECQEVRLEERSILPEDVAVIGYPAWDGNRNPGSDMPRIFEDVYRVKRLAPGFLISVESQCLEHDCSTLGGNSGSLVWGLRSGKALGLHWAGDYKDANYAVPAPVVAEIAKKAGVRT